MTGPASAAILLLLLGCASTGVIPPSLYQQVDRSLTFAQLKDSPDSYRGRLILAGGEVLDAKLLKQGTRLVVLQLPLLDSQEPGLDRTASQGRFLAIQKEFLDPATLPEGTRVTIVGEVTGATTLPLDETDYAYPTLEIKHLKVWPGLIASQDSAMGPHRTYGGLSGSSYWGWGPLYGYYPYGYWGIPYWRYGGGMSWQERPRVKTWTPTRHQRKRH